MIPKGQYGAGTVMIWDKGTYQSMSPLPVDEQLTRGKIDVTLDGHKLRGGFTLLKTRPRSAADRRGNWLLIKHRDEHADPKWNVEAEALGRSVVPGLTLKRNRRACSKEPMTEI